MKKPALLAFDLDGTLVGSDDHISPRTKSAIRRARQQGAQITIATGRRPMATIPSALALGIDLPVICYNGGLMVDVETRRSLHSNTLDPHLARRAIHIIQGHEITALLYRHTATPPDILYQADPSHPAVARYIEREKENILRVPDLPEACDSEILRILCFGDDESIGRATETLSEAVSPQEAWVLTTVHRGLRHLEIYPSTVSKGRALARLARTLGVPMSRVMAFGDGPNDVDFLQTAGIGVAMANAVPETLAAADIITASQEEDGVAMVLEQVFGTQPLAH